MTKLLTYIEIDVPKFDSPSSPNDVETWRFTYDVDYLPADIEAIASLRSLSFTPSVISLGGDLGFRASLSVGFSDHRHIFISEAFNSGTFWGKWRARHGTKLRGYALRWIQGTFGQTLSEMETRHFTIESSSGPDTSGMYQIRAQDILKLADDDRSQAPVISSGFLTGDLTDVETSATIGAAGIGDAEYPSSGHVAIGGEEICAFTRSGDNLTLTRGQLGTDAVAHESGDRVQLVLRYSGENPADIIYDLLVNYAGISSSFINLTSWTTETENFLQRLYTATIPEPVAVRELVSELIEQAALAIWWEPLTQNIRLQVLRSISTDADVFDEDNTLEDSLRIKEQPETRVSRVWCYFGQRNSLLPLDEINNYRSVAVDIDPTAETEYGTPAIKKIFSRWIPFGGTSVAERAIALQISRFRDPPRRFNFSLFRYGSENPTLGSGYRLKAWPLQLTDGSADSVPIQITSLNPREDIYEVEAEEALFATVETDDLNQRTITIDSDVEAVNLRSLHDDIYPEPETGSPTIFVTCYINANVLVGSTGISTPAFDVGSWPAGIQITIVNNGNIIGAGGDGGDCTGPSVPVELRYGNDGGTALYTRVDITLENNGNIAGGGGGGGAGHYNDTGHARGGGGGGAGIPPGQPGLDYDNGSTKSPSGEAGNTLNGGDGGFSGASGGTGFGDDGNNINGGRGGGGGGGAGADGGDSTPSTSGGTALGGSVGTAIDGTSFVTKSVSGSIYGGEVN